LSDEISFSDVALLSSNVLEAIRTLTELQVDYDQLPTTGLPRLSLQTLTGSPIEKRYKNGSYIGNYRFALYLRQSTQDNDTRLNSVQELTDLAGKVETLNLDCGESISFWGIKPDTLPVKVDSDEAYDDIQVTFTLKFKKG
jgi:hypothetical protein